MTTKLLTILIGLIGGVAVGVQTPMNGSIGRVVGSTGSSFIVHLSGMVLSAALLFLQGGQQIRDWTKLPWYMAFVGAFGVILFLTINVTIPRLGSLMAITLIITGQLVVGIVIDHFGWFDVPIHPVTLQRVAGVLLLLLGGYLIAR